MPTPLINLLIVDDQTDMRRVLRTALGTVGFVVHEASSGESALGAMRPQPPELVLLDVKMPGIGGIEACRRIRDAVPGVGIVMMSVRGHEDDKVQALEAGADDYVTKPFRLRELLARLRSILRRTRAGQSAQPAVLRAGDLELDPEARVFRKAGVTVHLSQKEFALLAYLMRHRDAPVPHARLLQAIWGPEYGGETEYLRTYMRHLRQKIEEDPAKPQYIRTEPWLGYRFCGPEHPEESSAPRLSQG